MISKKIANLINQEIDPAFARRAAMIGEAADISWVNSGKVNILDVGCGRGWYEKMLTVLLDKSQIYAIDQNEKYLKQAMNNVRSKRVNFKMANAYKLPFKNNFFDGAVCSELLEHVENDELVLKEILRVLKPGGKLLLTVPHANYPMAWDPLNWWLEKLFKVHVRADIWWLAGIWADHVRLYKRKDLKVKLENNGFEILTLLGSTKFCAPFSHFLLYGVGKNLVEAGCLKDFNRFNFKRKNKKLQSCVKWFFKLWDKKNLSIDSSADTSWVNLVATVAKPN